VSGNYVQPEPLANCVEKGDCIAKI
jgi:hypothetical protein